MWWLLLCAVPLASCGVVGLVFSNTPDEFGRDNPFDPDSEDYGGVTTEDTDGDGIGDYLDADEIIQVSPDSGSTIGDITPELRIRAKSPEVVSGYRFQLSTDTGLTELLLDVEDGLWNMTGAPPGMLENGNTYYWRGGVEATGGEEYWGEVWSFTLDRTQTESSGETPEDNGVTNDTTPLLSWQQTVGAERYRVQIARDAALAEMAEDEETSAAESEYQVAGVLENGRTHYWRVRAEVGGVWQEWSEAYTFGVDTSAVALTAPEDTAIVVSTTPTFRWETNPMAVRYHLVLDDDWDSSSPVMEDETITTTEYTSAVALQHGCSYFWKVAAIDTDHVQGTFSTTRGLTVDRYHVALLSPQDGSTADSSVTVFEWADNTSADSYRLMVADNADFTDPVADIETTKITHTLFVLGSEVLGTNRTYYWRVKISDPSFESASWSNVWSFAAADFPSSEGVDVFRATGVIQGQLISIDTDEAIVSGSFGGEVHIQGYSGEDIVGIDFRLSSLAAGTTTIYSDTEIDCSSDMFFVVGSNLIEEAEGFGGYCCSSGDLYIHEYNREGISGTFSVIAGGCTLGGMFIAYF